MQTFINQSLHPLFLKLAGSLELAVQLIWYYPVVILCLFCGLLFTIKFKFIQFRGFSHAISLLRGRYDDPDEPGHISHFQALMAALSGTIGLGNIAGVAIAISIGGPGTIFWMWLVGVLGMATKFVECTLGTKYRNVNPETKEVHGGPMVYIKKKLPTYLHLLLNGAYENKPVTHIFLLDPYIIPKNSNLYLVPYLKFFISNVRSSASRPIEYANWHVNRPSAALHELLKLTQTIQQQLQMPLTGLKTYPQLTVFTAENDPTSATEGADLIASAFGDDKLSLVRFNSDRHVIIEPQAKLNWSLQDQQHFDSVVNTVFLAIQP